MKDVEVKMDTPGKYYVVIDEHKHFVIDDSETLYPRLRIHIQNWLGNNEITQHWLGMLLYHNGDGTGLRTNLMFEYEEDAMAFKLRWL